MITRTNTGKWESYKVTIKGSPSPATPQPEDNTPAGALILAPGAVITWGGNYGFQETTFCILSRIESKYGVSYDCYNLDDSTRNDHPHRVEARSIKSRDDESLWHSQHYFLEDQVIDPEALEAIRLDQAKQIAARKDHEAEETRKADALEAEGRKLWKSLLGDCPAVILAVCEHDESDLMTDYFGNRTTATVILAASKHHRGLFPEFRKAADLLPETQHLGVGKGKFTPYVAIGADFRSNGSCYYKGSRSHWHGELDKNENGDSLVFLTRAEAEAYIAGKGEPYTVNFDGTPVPFEWQIDEDKIEHREKYSMGKGYYLGYRYESGWHVCKRSLPKDGPTRGDYITLALRHDHLKPIKK